jgi:hypothetical protein
MAKGSKSWETSFNLSDFLEYKYNFKFETDFFTTLFRKTPILVLLDGIDEVPENKKVKDFILSQEKAQKWIINQKNSILENNGFARVILTSRPNKSERFWKNFEVFQVQNLSREEIACFSTAWYAEYARQLDSDLRMYPQRNSIEKKLMGLDQSLREFNTKASEAPLSKIIKNPLLLSLTLIMHAVEEQLTFSNVEGLYTNFITALLHKWDDVRDMNFYPELFGDSNRAKLFFLACEIAYNFSIEDTRQMEAAKILQVLETHVPKLHPQVDPQTIKPLCKQLLETFRDRAGLLTGKSIDEDDFEKTVFEFQHQTFQEFLTAYVISKQDRLKESNLWEKVGSDQWKETITFYLQFRRSRDFFDEFTKGKANKAKYEADAHFVAYYWLHAPDEFFYEEWKVDLVAWLIAIFDASDDVDQIRKAYTSLAKIPNPDLQSVVDQVERFTHGSPVDALKFGMRIDLLQRQRKWAEIREWLATKVRLMYHGDPHYLLPLAMIQVATFHEKDLKFVLFFDEMAKENIARGFANPGGGATCLLTTI